MRQAARQRMKPRRGRRRKQEGAVYTPAFITRYIVEQALGGVLKAPLRSAPPPARGGSRRHRPQGPGRSQRLRPDRAQRTAAQGPHPLLGSLAGGTEAPPHSRPGLRQRRDSSSKPSTSSTPSMNSPTPGWRNCAASAPSSTSTGRFSNTTSTAWTSTPRPSKSASSASGSRPPRAASSLTSLDHTIREGNSVISDPAVHPKAFDWQAAFPEVFAQGGFDVVVGNPPYIRQELLTPLQAVAGSPLRRLPRHGGPLRLFLRTGRAAAETGRPALLHRHQQMDEGRLRRTAPPLLQRKGLGAGRWWTSATPNRFSRKPMSSPRSSSWRSRPKRPSPRRPGSAPSPASNCALTT